MDHVTPLLMAAAEFVGLLTLLVLTFIGFIHFRAHTKAVVNATMHSVPHRVIMIQDQRVDLEGIGCYSVAYWDHKGKKLGVVIRTPKELELLLDMLDEVFRADAEAANLVEGGKDVYRLRATLDDPHVVRFEFRKVNHSSSQKPAAVFDRYHLGLYDKEKERYE